MNISQVKQKKGETLLCIDTKKYKLLNDLSVYEKKTVKSTFIYNKKQKNMIIACVFNQHAKHEFNDFKNNHIRPLLDKFSNENRDIMIIDYFKINLIDYNYDKSTCKFLDTMFSQSFLLILQHQLELQETQEHQLVTSFVTSL